MKKTLTPAQKQRRRFNSAAWLFNDEARRSFNDQPRRTEGLSCAPLGPKGSPLESPGTEAKREGGGNTPPTPPLKREDSVG